VPAAQHEEVPATQETARSSGTSFGRVPAARHRAVAAPVEASNPVPVLPTAMQVTAVPEPGQAIEDRRVASLTLVTRAFGQVVPPLVVE
jgi:hypothetical protein